jgi:hypothetical protein
MSVQNDNAVRQAWFENLRAQVGGTQTDTSTFVVAVEDGEKRVRLVEVSVVLKKPEANLADMLDEWESVKVERAARAAELESKREAKAKADAAKKAKKG